MGNDRILFRSDPNLLLLPSKLELPLFPLNVTDSFPTIVYLGALDCRPLSLTRSNRQSSPLLPRLYGGIQRIPHALRTNARILPMALPRLSFPALREEYVGNLIGERLGRMRRFRNCFFPNFAWSRVSSLPYPCLSSSLTRVHR